ncbi:MAG TPA: hypothetical protein VKV73_10990 [Chloroflexota bacterium]|nr:hypothetical protein [Chloroflexota bacterium]
MQLIANLSKRVPIRGVAPTLVAVLAVAGVLGHGAPIFRGILGLVGQGWG